MSRTTISNVFRIFISTLKTITGIIFFLFYFWSCSLFRQVDEREFSISEVQISDKLAARARVDGTHHYHGAPYFRKRTLNSPYTIYVTLESSNTNLDVLSIEKIKLINTKMTEKVVISDWKVLSFEDERNKKVKYHMIKKTGLILGPDEYRLQGEAKVVDKHKFELKISFELVLTPTHKTFMEHDIIEALMGI